MTRLLARFIAWGEDVLHRHERGDEHAIGWVMFVNLTVISLAVLAVVLLLQWWLA